MKAHGLNCEEPWFSGVGSTCYIHGAAWALQHTFWNIKTMIEV